MTSKLEEDHSPFITVTHGMSGYFAVHMWWNNTGEGGLPGFWEPYNTGIGRYRTKEEAAVEAKEWAEAEGTRYVGASL